MDRRTVLKAGAASLAGLGLGATTVRAATGSGLRFLDVHNHFAAPAFLEFNRRFVPGSGPLPWNLADVLADMDAAGTGLSILSGFTPSEGGTAEDRAQLARATNEYGASLARDHPRRFALFATLPLPDIAASLKEATYALDTLGAVGLTVYTDAGKLYLGDKAFDELWTELDRRRAVVFVHPHAPACCAGQVPGVPDTVIEFGTATSRTIASLVLGGATQRFPNVRFIFSHGGGTVPFLIERFLGGGEGELAPGVITRAPRNGVNQPPGGALAELRKLFYDTAQISNPVSLAALKSVMGTSQILFGTDVWFRTEADTVRGVVTSGVFNAQELRAVAAGNTLRLLPSLAPKFA